MHLSLDSFNKIYIRHRLPKSDLIQILLVAYKMKRVDWLIDSKFYIRGDISLCMNNFQYIILLLVSGKAGGKGKFPGHVTFTKCSLCPIKTGLGGPQTRE